MDSALLEDFKVWLGNDPKLSEGMQHLDEFRSLMTCYQSVIREVRTKLDILNDEMALKEDRNPIQFITSRIKKPISIGTKLAKKEKPISVDNIRETLNDVAGIRVICSYTDDIYWLAEMLTKQDDVYLIETKDYIKNPKENGYRSLHLILEVPIFLSDRKEAYRIEVQIRTIAMDYWASLEHSLRYKKEMGDAGLGLELEVCAREIAAIEDRMLAIREKIDN
ncbi:GTP pyrophosphokinase [Listeria newyorkensis]|uniref:GTP pyrophosphokinase family protein n=1 Tax=Listeria newyorkensis TaxID=1497681 RepID=A0A841YUL9_9LIST|nr:GTP pyrophosphokinase family protein [Listeria newyorkensis]MBC1456662.1 GTP pyrophosphokinase family protein [Listeria newyorkensis]